MSVMNPCSCRIVLRIGVALFVLVFGITSDAFAQEAWSGTITMVESITGPGNMGGSDRAELEDYTRQLTERLQRARADILRAPPSVARVLREDIGTFDAELERVVVARGEPITIATSIYTVKGRRMAVQGGGVRMVVDRDQDDAEVQSGTRRERVPLAPLPEARALDKGDDVPLPAINATARKLSLRAEGKTYAVLVVSGLPNPFALGLLPASGDDKDSFAQALASLPGLPVQVEYQRDEITHRWVVTALEARPVSDAEVAQ